MTTKQVSGVYAALLAPRHPADSIDGTIDVPALRRLLDFLLAQGIASFAVNGATGEFCLTSPAHLHTLLTTVREAAGDRAQILCGVGAPGTAQAVELAAIASSDAFNVQALLLPMPSFFPYQQEDLDAFCRSVAASTDLPILLYNLPQFTSGLEKDTVRALIADVPNIIGIKDSSGSLDILRDLSTHLPEACRIVGNDSALAPALREGLCDGVVSGVACALPELILALYAQTPASTAFQIASTLLDEFIRQLNPFPTPWGLKWIAEARGLLHATFAQPVTPHRRAQAAELASWFAAWHPKAVQSIQPAK